MEKYLNELIDIGMGNVIAMNVDKVITKDEVYQRNMENASTVLDKFKNNLSTEYQELFEEYMDYIMNANERACNLAYLVGAKNTIQFLK